MLSPRLTSIAEEETEEMVTDLDMRIKLHVAAGKVLALYCAVLHVRVHTQARSESNLSRLLLLYEVGTVNKS